MGLLVATSAFAYFAVSFFELKAWWTPFADPLTGLVTFMIALLVWYNEGRHAREEKLPKRLTVRFLHEGRLVLFCENASLATKGDIRKWGQQIGKQMNHNQRLKLNITFTIAEQKPRKFADGNRYKPYFIEFHLAELPFTPESDSRDKLTQDLYMHWSPDHFGQISENWLPHPTVLPPLTENLF